MTETMKAMVLYEAGEALKETLVKRPNPDADQILIRVHACAVCRTDIHIMDGELTSSKLPLIPGHEIIGSVAGLGANVVDFKLDERVGVPWLGWTCGNCHHCKRGHENLCDDARFTGYTLDGGFAEYMVADHRYCFPVPDTYTDVEAAPLMCAGLIGYRALRMAGDTKHLGLYGFGAAAHIITQIAVHKGICVYAFTKEGDFKAQTFARTLGATWAGGSNEKPPHMLDSAIIFAPAGLLVPTALRSVDKAGIVICAGIHMSDIPTFPYEALWQERIIRSVANLTRGDGEEFLKVAPEVPVKTRTHQYPLHEANAALDDLRNGRFEGAAVLKIS